MRRWVQLQAQRCMKIILNLKFHLQLKCKVKKSLRGKCKDSDFDEKFPSDSNEQLSYFRTKCQRYLWRIYQERSIVHIVCELDFENSPCHVNIPFRSFVLVIFCCCKNHLPGNFSQNLGFACCISMISIYFPNKALRCTRTTFKCIAFLIN